MLIVKNLKKTYKTKGGVEVHALDDVSITFPENGMVFLLGKSGSGKSTLLNVIGGLDRVDSGEIIVKGKNSKTFSGADYDSYRNTFIGFIFQEYNILNEFNVEQNISLALQLQGKPNDKKAVEEILEKVDLKGLGKRKPNTLSGGQKQRVAIARALIKNPEIIMADEPTGALDSNTGKQVFETLKKLSKDKLVIVVSHDRDFAEHYGDRIIELSDGKIISDTSKEYVEPKQANSNVHIINDHTVAIRDTSKLTSSDMDVIFKALKDSKGEAVITSGEHDLPLVRQAIHINSDNSSEVFNDTGEVETKEYNPSETKFIRSKLPMARAFKMGSSTLKTKPIRLIVTSLLTIVALTMFGLTSTLMLFKESYSIYKALQHSDYNSEVVEKKYKLTNVSTDVDILTGERGDSYSWDDERKTYFGVDEVKQMNNNNTGLKFAGIISFNGERGSSSFQIDSSKLDFFYKKPQITGFSDAGNEYLSNNGMGITHGTYPTHANEIAISEYHFNVLKLAMTGITSETSILNKEVSVFLSGNKKQDIQKFKVVGIFKGDEIPEKFNALKDIEGINSEEANQLSSTFDNYLGNSFNLVTFVSADFFDTYKDEYLTFVENNYWWNPHLPIRGVRFETDWDPRSEPVSYEEWRDIGTEKLLQYIDTKFYDLSGNEIDESTISLSSNQVYVSYDRFRDKQNEQKQRYFENIYDIVGNKAYDEELFALVQGHEEHYWNLTERLRNSNDSWYIENYPEGFDYQDDLEEGTNLINTYYDKVMDRWYVTELARRLNDGFYCVNGDEDSNLEFKSFHQKLEQMTSVEPFDMTYFNDIKQYVIADSNNYLKHHSLMNFSDRWWDESEDHNRLDDIRNRYYGREYVSQDEYDFVEEMIEKHVELGRYDTLSYDASVINKMPPLRTTRAYYASSNGTTGEFEIVGYIEGYEYFMSHNFASTLGSFEAVRVGVIETVTDYKLNEDARYAYVITPTTFAQNQVGQMIGKHGTYFYAMTDNLYYNIFNYISMIKMLEQVFLIVGLVCAAFAALMLLNFISSSITAKIREIGILRAVGARGGDLFKIFFSESGLIASICSVIAIIATIITCWRLNVMMAKEIGIYLLDFNILNIGLILVGAFVITVLGTIIPVAIAAKKPPVDSIRTL